MNYSMIPNQKKDSFMKKEENLSMVIDRSTRSKIKRPDYKGNIYFY